MSLLDKSASKAQLIDILNSMKFPIMGAGGGFAPIGTINFFDASVAPQGWLACDGTVYNITDYPDLATYYASVHGSSNFYGGDGVTTFAVPDLRGEFLRGTGTNGHANQGSGANVGVHQDGTEISNPWIDPPYKFSRLSAPAQTGGTAVQNADSLIAKSGVSGIGITGTNDGTANGFATSRPTNTSFLICVKATVAGDPNGHVYSTDEQIVGTDEDGNTIYEKTIKITNASFSSGQDTTIAHNILNIGEAWVERLLWRNNDGTTTNMPKVSGDNLSNRIVLRKIDSSNLFFKTYGDSWTSSDYNYIKATIQYTKTQ